MRKIQSDCLFPISSNPIPNGILIFSEKGVISDVIDPAKIDYNVTDIQHFSGIICPGFINTHCHLELSYLKSKIDKNSGLHSFVIQIQKLKKSSRHELIFQYIKEMDEIMCNQGIVAVADILNTTDTLEAKSQSKIYYHNFIELIGSDPEYADIIFQKGVEKLNDFELNVPQNKTSLTLHSLYAVSRELLENIVAHSQEHSDILSFHHLEGQEEKDYFLNKKGTIPERLKSFNVDISSFKPSGKTPLETYYNILQKTSNILLVHNIYAHQKDVEFACRNLKNIWWCLCPNSNLFIENKLPDVNLMINNKCKLTIGSDSLASNSSLNILSELLTLQKKFNVSTHDLLKMATLNGAQYMKIDNSFGSLCKNKTPGLVLIKNVNPDDFHFNDGSEAVRIS